MIYQKHLTTAATKKSSHSSKTTFVISFHDHRGGVQIVWVKLKKIRTFAFSQSSKAIGGLKFDYLDHHLFICLKWLIKIRTKSKQFWFNQCFNKNVQSSSLKKRVDCEELIYTLVDWWWSVCFSFFLALLIQLNHDRNLKVKLNLIVK